MPLAPSTVVELVKCGCTIASVAHQLALAEDTNWHVRNCAYVSLKMRHVKIYAIKTHFAESDNEDVIE